MSQIIVGVHLDPGFEQDAGGFFSLNSHSLVMVAGMAGIDSNLNLAFGKISEDNK